jgi:hypothetical protein
MSRDAMRLQRESLKSHDFAAWLVEHYGGVIRQHLQGRANLTRDDLEYTVEKAASLKDERLAACIATLIGWGDDERAEVETFCAIALEVMRHTPPSRLRECARLVELRSLMQEAGE